MNVTHIIMVATIVAQAWSCVVLTYVVWTYRRSEDR